MLYREIELCCVPIKKSFNIFVHHFLRIDGYHLHLGRYRLGKIHPVNSKQVNCYQRLKLCMDCHQTFVRWVNSSNDVIAFNWFFPVINCETLVRGYSTQFNVCLATVVLSFAAVLFNFIQLLIPIILSAVLWLHLYNINLRTCETNITCCPHLK